MSKKLSRRSFNQSVTAATVALAAPAVATRGASILGANDRVRLGFLGVANRGGQLMTAFLKHADAQIAAVCDVHKPTLAKAAQRLDGAVVTEGDFRRVLERDDLDAIVIATPDHWHAAQTVAACRSGKDVYVEKPASVTVHEGRRMVEVARETDRIVQVGTHRRSSGLYATLAERIASGRLGKVTVMRAYRLSNMAPSGIGRLEPTDPPADLDWDMWLGPRPSRPYQENITPYKFRWWQLYSSQLANWGIHYLDAMRWLSGELAPVSVCSMGGRFAVDDDRTIPDTAETIFEFGSGRLAIFGQYEASGHPIFPRGEMELRGTDGVAYIGGSEYEIIPERGGQFQDRQPRCEPETSDAAGSNHDLTAQHARNFLDCIKSRTRPAADIEIGHRSTTMSLIANISLALGERVYWDAKLERFVDNDSANALLHYEYRKPWTLD